MRQAEARWDGDFADVPSARSWARRQLESLGASAVEWELLQVLSELASNAAIHAHSPFLVRLTVAPGRLRLEVADESPSGVTPRNYTADATTGRGMLLVNELAQDWGVTVDGAGKSVWADFDLAETGQDDDSSTSQGDSVTAAPVPAADEGGRAPSGPVALVPASRAAPAAQVGPAAQVSQAAQATPAAQAGPIPQAGPMPQAATAPQLRATSVLPAR